MNKAYKDYKINGWIIQASEYYNDWDLTPAYEETELIENFRNKQEIRFDKLADAKKWVKTEEAKQLKDNYSKLV